MDELSNYIFLSKSKIYKMVAKSEIPYHKAGKRRTVFDRTEIDQWIKNGCIIEENLPELPTLNF